MNRIFYKITCKTNLHVGSGKANYGVIDQLVQRDPTFQYPTIHASSLKGGIKEYCDSIHFQKMVEVFGSEKINGKTNHEESQIGSYKFFDANLLAIPVRCDKRAYIHITCPNILKDFADHLPEQNQLRKEILSLTTFLSEDVPIASAFTETLRDATIEDFDIKASYDDTIALSKDIRNLFNNIDFVIVKNNYFDRLTNDLHLPVIARNYLENGESKNLWYEQVMPRLTVFWSSVNHEGSDILFDKHLFKKDVLVQIGANGSIGYGYSSFSELKIN
jgi:CRISPR-associated protein Cmr4